MELLEFLKIFLCFASHSFSSSPFTISLSADLQESDKYIMFTISRFHPILFFEIFLQ